MIKWNPLPIFSCHTMDVCFSGTACILICFLLVDGEISLHLFLSGIFSPPAWLSSLFLAWLIILLQDLCGIGVTALGPRKKIIHALNEIKIGCRETDQPDESKTVADATNKLSTNKLITDYFPGSIIKKNHNCVASERMKDSKKNHSGSARGIFQKKKHAGSSKQKDTPSWCRIPGTPFCIVSNL